jgi:cytidylate kinase
VKKGFIIAIDGPLASGKGTIAKKLALRLQGIDLYTGAMYRSLALLCINSGINLENANEVIMQLPELRVSYQQGRILLDDADVTDAIGDSAIAEGASIIAVIPKVRKEFVKRQQAIGMEGVKSGKIVVVEGRDIGTVVFPKAALKIYLTATVAVRAKRRLLQYSHYENKLSYDEIVKQLKKRDERDTLREIDPLARDPEKFGYFILDNSAMNEEETIEAIIQEVKRRKLLHD